MVAVFQPNRFNRMAVMWPEYRDAFVDAVHDVGTARTTEIEDIDLPGCLAVIGWNYRDDGMAAGRLAVRVLKGESPAKMAFEPLTKTDLLVSEATAKAIGVTLPPALVALVDQVVPAPMVPVRMASAGALLATARAKAVPRVATAIVVAMARAIRRKSAPGWSGYSRNSAV